MSKWEFIVWMIPFVWVVAPIMKWMGFGFFPSVYVGIFLILPIAWLAKKVVRPEDLR